MAVLTQRQEQILNFIIKRIKEKGYPPSVREIGANVGLSSTSTVHAHLTRLEEKGIIRKDPTKPRALEIIDPDYFFSYDPSIVEIPILKQITKDIEENTKGYFKLSKETVGESPAFILVANNNILKPTSILDGDYVIVSQQRTIKVGELVVSLEGEGSIKKYTKGEQVLGKVIGIIRLKFN